MFSFFKAKPPLVTDLSWLEVDLHSHLLPGLDDGAADVETSIYLIKALQELGIKKFICTPHIYQELYPNTPETIASALGQLQTALATQSIPVALTAAAEYMVDNDFEVKPGLLCLSKQYLLIEMSYLNETPNIEQLIFDLQIKGYQVVLAHPERYNFYHKTFYRYQRFKDMGVLFQLNLLAVAGYYGNEVKKTAEQLLAANYYDLAATDLHHDKHLEALINYTKSGRLYQKIGQYPFKNKALFL